MQVQDKDAIGVAKPIQKSKRVPLLTSISFFIGIALLTGLGVTVFAYSHTPSNSATITQKTSAWQRVLNGYSLVSLTAVPSNPAVLYACGTPLQSLTPTPQGANGLTTNYTLLRSANGGTTWQQVIHGIANCQVAINPMNSDDIYTVGLAGHVASNGEVPNVLRHSTDGGRSWTDIAPTINTGNAQLAIPWHMQQLTMVGNHLFGIQLIPSARVQPIVKLSPVGVVTRLDLSRLIESSDGGHTWSIVDGNLNVTGQGTYDYTVSPSDAQMIYELVGTQGLPYGQPTIPRNMPTSYRNLILYKTTNGGGTWTKLRENIQYGSKIRIASNNASFIFVGSSTSIVSPINPVVSPLPVYFSLTVSKDGGATWGTIKKPANVSLASNWFVSADGHVYLATGNGVSGQPTGIVGTAVPIGTRQIKPVGVIVTSNPGVSVGNVTSIQRYDMAKNSWSVVTKTPASGTLLAVTTNATTHTDTLWFLSDGDNAQVLYREML